MNIKALFIKHIFSFLLIILLLASNAVLAYDTMAVGQILNRTDKSPIAAVNIFFKNTSIGVQSNEEGYFKISTSGAETTLVFTSIGYKDHEIKLKQGQAVGVEVELDEDNTLLQEVFITPGSNPALEWIKKIRLTKKANDVSRLAGFKAKSKEQNLVLLSKINQRSLNKKIYEQLRKGTLNQTDTSLVIPLYMSENTYQLFGNDKKLLRKDIFSSPEVGEKILAQLVGELETELNFYNNSISVFGKSMISPLSTLGYTYYDYYLADSTKLATGKQYDIHFRSKNEKNLAFNGRLLFDSATLAITHVEAELPVKANINFIHNLRISQQYEQLPNKRWTRANEEMSLNMTYGLLADSLHSKPEIFIKRTATYQSADTIIGSAEKFAKSDYDQTTLNDKLGELNNTPVLRAAKWLANVILTGYVPMGKVDYGKIQNLARFTDIEGLRLNLPFRTNEKLWKNISLSGYAGYGFRNKELKYNGLAQFRLPGEKKRVLGINYVNDYRIINFDYNNFIYHEGTLVSGDEDIASTILALFRSADRMNERKEFLVTFTNDWNSNLETKVFLRANQLYSNQSLPMTNTIGSIASFQYQSATIENRFSFGERTYEDHLQRIYISNYKPVLYGAMELGKFQLGSETGNYAKLYAAIKQYVRLDFGQLNYIVEGGWIFGKVPYPLLQIPFGTDTGGYSFYYFNLMRLMEYGTDKYANLHSELMLNGLILNQIPLVKNLNLREMCSFHMAYGGLSDAHKALLNYPTFMQPLNKPYMEVGVGVTNIVKLFTVQSVWRLSDLNKEKTIPWGILVSLSLSF